jgi:hypothetical protein
MPAACSSSAITHISAGAMLSRPTLRRCARPNGSSSKRPVHGPEAVSIFESRSHFLYPFYQIRLSG